MNKKSFIESEAASSEKTKKMFLRGRVSKKAIIFGAIVVILIIVIGISITAAHWKLERYSSLNATDNGRIMKNYSGLLQPDNRNGFVVPQDAAKSGSIAIIVSDLDSARNSVQNIATQNGGVVYSTFIAYASSNIKSGSIVVQVPDANFDTTFDDLKKIGSQIIQESSKQIPIMNPIIYPQAQPMVESSDVSANSPKEDSTTNSDVTNVTNEKTTTTIDQGTNNSTVVSVPTIMPIYEQITQNKGYIEVIFADYGKRNSIAGAKTNIENMFGVGYGGENMRDNIWVVLAIKSIVLIALIVFIIIISKKIIINLQKKNKQKTYCAYHKASDKEQEKSYKNGGKHKEKITKIYK